MHIISYFQRRMISYIMCVYVLYRHFYTERRTSQRKLIFLSETCTHLCIILKLTIQHSFFIRTCTSLFYSYFYPPFPLRPPNIDFLQLFFHFRLARTSLCFFFNNYFSNLFLDKRDYLHHFHLTTQIMSSIMQMI